MSYFSELKGFFADTRQIRNELRGLELTIGEKEFFPIGSAVCRAQRLEFALYGIASHAVHTEEAKKHKSFKDFNPEQFLRGDVSK